MLRYVTAITFVSCGFITLNAADFWFVTFVVCYFCGHYNIGGLFGGEFKVWVNTGLTSCDH